jgi:hypothetical protein
MYFTFFPNCDPSPELEHDHQIQVQKELPLTDYKRQRTKQQCGCVEVAAGE